MARAVKETETDRGSALVRQVPLMLLALPLGDKRDVDDMVLERTAFKKKKKKEKKDTERDGGPNRESKANL